MYKLTQLLVFIILFCCWGCSEKIEPAILEVETYSLTFEGKGGEQPLTFTTNTTWKAEIDHGTPWVKIFPTISTEYILVQ